MGSNSFTMPLEVVRPRDLSDTRLRDAHRAIWGLVVARLLNNAHGPSTDELVGYLGNVGDDGYQGGFAWHASSFHFFWKDYGGSAERMLVALAHWIEVATALEEPAIQKVLRPLGLAWRPEKTPHTIRNQRSVLAQVTLHRDDGTHFLELFAFNDESDEASIIAWTDNGTWRWDQLDEAVRSAIREVRAQGRCNCSMCHRVDDDPLRARALAPEVLAEVDALEARLASAQKSVCLDIAVEAAGAPNKWVRDAARRALPANFLREATPTTLAILRRIIEAADERAVLELLRRLATVKGTRPQRVTAGELLVAALARPEPSVVREALEALAKLEVPVSPALVKAWRGLAVTDEEVALGRARLIKAIATARSADRGLDDAAVIETVCTLLGAPSRQARVATLQAIRSLTHGSLRTWKPLALALVEAAIEVAARRGVASEHLPLFFSALAEQVDFPEPMLIDVSALLEAPDAELALFASELYRARSRHPSLRRAFVRALAHAEARTHESARRSLHGYNAESVVDCISLVTDALAMTDSVATARGLLAQIEHDAARLFEVSAVDNALALMRGEGVPAGRGGVATAVEAWRNGLARRVAEEVLRRGEIRGIARLVPHLPEGVSIDVVATAGLLAKAWVEWANREPELRDLAIGLMREGHGAVLATALRDALPRSSSREQLAKGAQNVTWALLVSAPALVPSLVEEVLPLVHEAGRPNLLYNSACAIGLLGDGEAAAAVLARAIELDPSQAADARTDSDFAPVRSHPAMVALLGRP
jgi:hypothetical protein